MTENIKKPLQVYFDPELRAKIDKEAQIDGRSTNKQIIHFIQEQLAIREWNRKAAQDAAQ